MSPCTYVGKNEVMCFYFDLIADTFTASYASYTVMALLYGEAMGRE